MCSRRVLLIYERRGLFEVVGLKRQLYAVGKRKKLN